MIIVEDEIFEKQDFSKKRLPKGDYEYCTFINCNFAEGLLSEVKFLECDFEDCNLSAANVMHSSFQDVNFKNCKMLGVHFNNCNLFGFAVKLNNCNLENASFYQVNLQNSEIIATKCLHADFTEANLSGMNLDGCEFLRATFQYSILNKTDFRKARGYNINLEQNKIKGALFALEGVSGLLTTYQIIIE
ncbi:pentapeptide repeat-containing protein [Aestuariibaculum sediminum]|uniref:Pentapeptide repeat-containing protein n=1 Tax=Aestuariibaculum sediminum TaxID=2770637 RepID=A0A8J6UDT1_9FLAO|nr:pentapeptide repeat-containing protein [Aestuariibaculum sediminum]MBD0833129.1 pentapeptide repeat-containing protein [Aestuariibaculum sediminum]